MIWKWINGWLYFLYYIINDGEGSCGVIRGPGVRRGRGRGRLVGMWTHWLRRSSRSNPPRTNKRYSNKISSSTNKTSKLKINLKKYILNLGGLRYPNLIRNKIRCSIGSSLSRRKISPVAGMMYIAFIRIIGIFPKASGENMISLKDNFRCWRLRMSKSRKTQNTLKLRKY